MLTLPVDEYDSVLARQASAKFPCRHHTADASAQYEHCPRVVH
jgi:hypothetical protein